jgi:hypothetical protein
VRDWQRESKDLLRRIGRRHVVKKLLGIRRDVEGRERSMSLHVKGEIPSVVWISVHAGIL